jgi:hypothetical protein
MNIRCLAGMTALLTGVLCLCLSLGGSLPTHAASTTNVSLSAIGTATIDGAMSPGEWTSAASVSIPVNVPVSEGGGTASAMLYVMNDATQIYFAFKVPRAAFVTASFAMNFDNDNDGQLEAGDDGFVFNTDPFGPPTLFDIYRYTCPEAPAGSGGCSGFDDSDGGTTDGVGAVSISDGFTIYEVSRPLNNADDAHDFSLNPSGKLGFSLFYRVIVGEFPDGFSDTTFPLSGAGEIVIGNPVIPVDISVLNNINLKNPNKVKVAVLTTPQFNAEYEVNPTSIRFGISGNNAPPNPAQSKKVDIDADGDLDWVFEFTVVNTGIVCGTTSAMLTGKTIPGQSISGSAAIKTTGCK